MSEITNRNFELYAAQNYTNKRLLNIEEFYEDLAKFKYLKKLLTKYVDRKILRERLILNHLIKIYNVFDFKAATELCFFKCTEKQWSALKTFLLYLNYIEEREYINIPIDLFIVNKLQEI